MSRDRSADPRIYELAAKESMATADYTLSPVQFSHSRETNLQFPNDDIDRPIVVVPPYGKPSVGSCKCNTCRSGASCKC